ncbi:nitrate reductase [Proteobacteria bacterium 005FR1]|nr:nitrate reductase [Proteobacteria bacterium 005FR1]
MTCTTCPYCGVGCGVVATTNADDKPNRVHIQGDENHPANAGRLCVKGSALAETVGLEGRLLRPAIRNSQGTVGSTGWEQALDYTAGRLQEIIAQHGPEAVALYVSGQLLTEDYYVANKLVKGWLGTANIDTNSRLCMSSAVAGHKRAFGEDLVPCNYEDLEEADLVVLVGSNTAWCHPVLYQRLMKSRRERPEKRIVVIDPRRTTTCEQADLHLPVRAGSDVWLFNGLLTWLHQHGVMDADFVAQHTDGVDGALKLAREQAGRVEAVAKACGVPLVQLEQFYSMFAATPKVVTLFSQGVNQSSAGTDKVNSVINCHLLTGRIGKPGMGPFSITGQPNAMGGREVGGLANTLAAHMELDKARHREAVQEFWGSPHIASKPGLKAVDLFEAVHQGRIKALWIMGTNPVVSMPDAERVQQALGQCELLVVSDLFANTDTARHAEVVLPALGWGEKDGTVTNSERCISRQRAFLPAPGEAKPDWWALCEVAKRLDFSGFDYTGVHEIFSEHAQLSAWRNSPAELPRAFHIGGLADLDRAAYDAMTACQWPLPLPGQGTARLFSEGRFYHKDGKARFIATEARSPVNMPDADYPLVLNTGRIRDQWHTMTRTGRAPSLSGHLAEPFVAMHPYEAMLAGVQDGHLVRVSTRWGKLVARLRCTADQPRRSIFVPIHWTDQVASDARVGALVNPVVDPISGEPEFKHTPAKVTPFPVDWQGVVFSRQPLQLGSAPAPAYWVRVQGVNYLRYEVAGRGAMPNPREWCAQLMQVDSNYDWWESRDLSADQYHAFVHNGEALQACVFLSPRADLPSRGWLARLFERGRLGEADWKGLKLGYSVDPKDDVGRLVCSCFSVGCNTIVETVREQGLSSVEAVGRALRAGTNCGSCQPEIRQLIDEARLGEQL